MKGRTVTITNTDIIMNIIMEKGAWDVMTVLGGNTR
jgi:hypothetical protein